MIYVKITYMRNQPLFGRHIFEIEISMCHFIMSDADFTFSHLILHMETIARILIPLLIWIQWKYPLLSRAINGADSQSMVPHSGFLLSFLYSRLSFSDWCRCSSKAHDKILTEREKCLIRCRELDDFFMQIGWEGGLVGTKV